MWTLPYAPTYVKVLENLFCYPPSSEFIYKDWHSSINTFCSCFVVNSFCFLGLKGGFTFGSFNLIVSQFTFLKNGCFLMASIESLFLGLKHSKPYNSEVKSGEK